MPSVNDKFKGLGQEFYSSTPEDIADANKALARSLGQIKNVFNVTPTQLAAVGQELETLKGLDLLENSRVPDADTIAVYRNNLGVGSGPSGEMLLVDIVGTCSGWVHTDELTAETARLKEIDALGALDNLKAEPNGFDPGNSGNGIYTVIKYHVIHDSYYTPITGPIDPETGLPTIIPQWTIPANISLVSAARGIYGSKGAALKKLIDVANTEIARIASLYPIQASQSYESFKKMGNQIYREKLNQERAGIVFDDIPRNQVQPVYGFISNLHDYGKDTSLGGVAWWLEQLADTSNKGGQGIIGAMREGRNIQRLADAGIPVDNGRSEFTSVSEQATLLDSTYTVEEAKNSIKE